MLQFGCGLRLTTRCHRHNAFGRPTRLVCTSPLKPLGLRGGRRIVDPAVFTPPSGHTTHAFSLIRGFLPGRAYRGSSLSFRRGEYVRSQPLLSWRSASNTISRNQLSAFLETQANLTLHRASRKEKKRHPLHHPLPPTLFHFSLSILPPGVASTPERLRGSFAVAAAARARNFF